MQETAAGRNEEKQETLDDQFYASFPRGLAYRYIGEPYEIALFYTRYMSRDLKRTLSKLGRGEEVEFDYRGEVPGAPVIGVRRSDQDVFTAQGPNGWLDTPGHTHWEWEPGPKQIDWVAYDLLKFIKEQRGGAPAVILVPPSAVRTCKKDDCTFDANSSSRDSSHVAEIADPTDADIDHLAMAVVTAPKHLVISVYKSPLGEMAVEVGEQVKDRDEAIALAQSRNQEAIWELGHSHQ